MNPLHLLEITAAIAHRLGRAEINEVERDRIIDNFKLDIQSNVFHESIPAWAEVFAKSAELASKHAASSLCRSLDILHVALAITLGATEFCTFDQRQKAFAEAAGIAVTS